MKPRIMTYLGILGATFLISIFIIIFLYKRRNIQPLKKKSPSLIILSVIGNFLVIFNCSILLIYFESFAEAQNFCYYKKD